MKTDEEKMDANSSSSDDSSSESDKDDLDEAKITELKEQVASSLIWLSDNTVICSSVAHTSPNTLC